MTTHDLLIVDALADDAVDRIARAYGERARARDLDAFCALYDRDVTIFDTFAEQPIIGLDSWRAQVTQWFGGVAESDTNVADVTDLVVIGDGVHAAAHALVRYAVVEPDGSERYGMTNRLSWIVRRDDRDVWRIVHEHTSVAVDEATGMAHRG
ncbi:YybH family protein [Sanguibacter sp. A247]|uniref:YybH family protein n=1 Tax=unclassified Sanguibacter TaxID=2645534 RepID=UPI003FD84C04